MRVANTTNSVYLYWAFWPAPTLYCAPSGLLITSAGSTVRLALLTLPIQSETAENLDPLP